MQCEQARQLFDAYLDGELSPSLATELGAHRVRCGECRRALALLEVSGHILRSDREPVGPPGDFTDRLLACVDGPRSWGRFRTVIQVGAPLAAAAVIAMAFLGVFDRRMESRVAGVQQIVAPPFHPETHRASASADSIPSRAAHPAVVDREAERALDEFFERTHDRMRDTGQSLQRAMDLTILQMLNILEEAKERTGQPMGTSPPVGGSVQPASSPSPSGGDVGGDPEEAIETESTGPDDPADG